MDPKVWWKVLGGSALFMGLVACGSVEVEVPDEAEAPNDEAAPEPSPAPDKAPEASGPGVKVDELNAHRADHVGKKVTVSGFYSSTTKQGSPVEQINVSVLASPEPTQANGEKTPKLLCIAKPENEGMFEGLVAGDEITVTGTVDESDFFGGAMLQDCVKGQGGGAAKPKEGDAKRGKKGKGRKRKKRAH